MVGYLRFHAVSQKNVAIVCGCLSKDHSVKLQSRPLMVHKAHGEMLGMQRALRGLP